MLTVKNTIVESWAVAVQWRITAMEYRERGIADYAGVNYTQTQIGRLQNAYQYWNKSINDVYTPLFIDLVDNFDQGGIGYSRFGTIGISDNVSGYTLSGIESIFLHNVNGVDTWIGSLKRQLIVNKPSGVTDNQIEELLNQY